MMELYSLAQAPGLTILNFDLKTESKINISVAKIPFFLDNSKISDSDILDKCPPVL